eukprot:Seg20613.1 transcript_id=Seg20613.1/GoldUCD/mRNA.D3Y31 product="hypothetical protein" protein_id=Seg20613.1/GoldUCD/D3Y31
MVYKVLPTKDSSVQGLKYTVLKRKPIVISSDVKDAFISPSDPSIIQIALTNEGGEKLRVATRLMEKGISQLAVVSQGKVLNIATLYAGELGKNFVITGIDNKAEAQELVRAMYLPLKGFDNIEIIEPETESIKEKSSAPAE